MNHFENTFIRGHSPSYSDESSSENAISITLPIGGVIGGGEDLYKKPDTTNNVNGKFHSSCVRSSYRDHQGRNTFAFWTVVVILLMLTVGNLLLTLTIIGVLRLGKGIEGMEMIPEVDVIKFYGITDLDRVYTKNIGQIDGFVDEPVSVTGESGGVHVRVFRNGNLQDRIILDKEGIVIRATNLFEVKDPSNKSQIFTTHRPQYTIPAGADVLLAKAVSASRITSPIDQQLKMNADEKISIKGSEGIVVDAGAALLQAENHITLNSTQGATILEAGAGIFLDMSLIPSVSSELGLRAGTVQYKLCVCMPQGTLFRLAVPRVHNMPKISCAHFSAKEDPCALN